MALKTAVQKRCRCEYRNAKAFRLFFGEISADELASKNLQAETRSNH
jgi:hypothetical protein